MQKKSHIILYQARNGAIELKEDLKGETFWASLQQIADLFDTDKSGISRHLKNIFSTGELSRRATVAIFATVQKEGTREITRDIEFYNLDTILSVGYRVNSKKATQFRQWATKTLRTHIIDGFTINPKRLAKNYDTFLKAVEDVKKLLPAGHALESGDVLELVKMFASTWFSLDAYDRSSLPQKGLIKKQVEMTAEELVDAIADLRDELMRNKQASELFAAERSRDALSGIVGNIFQSFGGKDLYSTVEEKAAHFLYFIVKNHPFADGNKRSGAFAFIWFLKRAGILDPSKITPAALTALTLLVAESKASDKERMIGLVLMLLHKS